MNHVEPNPPQPARRTIAPRILIAYRRTRYDIHTIEVRIGSRSAAIDNLLTAHRVREAALITAYNPFSRAMPPRWNHRMQSRLAQSLSRRATLPATGTLRQWSEAHLLVIGDTRPARRLARHFRQNSVVILRRGQPAQLHILVP